MNDKHNKTWRELAKQVRKGERHIICGEAADRLLNELPDEKLTEGELEAIVKASGGELDFGSARSEDVVWHDRTESVMLLKGGQGRSDQSVRDDADGCLALVLVAAVAGFAALVISYFYR